MNNDEEWEEEDQLVLITLEGVIDNEFLYTCESSNCRLLGIDTEEPVLQIGPYTFTGQFKESVGTHVTFEEKESSNGDDSKHLKYKCHTTKILEMTRSFLVEKTKEQEEVSSNFKSDQVFNYHYHRDWLATATTKKD